MPPQQKALEAELAPGAAAGGQPPLEISLSPASLVKARPSPAPGGFTLEGGGQGGARLPGADPADRQVALHAAALVQHAGVHGGACGRGDGSAAHQPPPGTGQAGGVQKICPNSYIKHHCLGVPCPTLRAQQRTGAMLFFSLRFVSVLGSEHTSHSTNRSRIRPAVRTGRALAPAPLPHALQEQHGK